MISQAENMLSNSFIITAAGRVRTVVSTLSTSSSFMPQSPGYLLTTPSLTSANTEGFTAVSMQSTDANDKFGLDVTKIRNDPRQHMDASAPTSARSAVNGPGRLFDRAVVVIPAHNEADHLPSSVRAVLAAAACLPLPVAVVVVLDGCDDGSGALAGQFGSDVHVVTIDARNVGAARAAGFSYARTLCEALDDARIWYATTDADSVVDPDWLLRQTGADADMVLGVVRIATWREFPAAATRRYLAAYRSKTRRDSHEHVHGANMGFRARLVLAGRRIRGACKRRRCRSGARFESAGLRIVRDAQLSVLTSRRQAGRAPDGFAAHLRSLLARGRAEPA